MNNDQLFHTGNAREHIAHLLGEAQRAVLSGEPVASVEKQIRAANLLLSQIVEETPKTGSHHECTYQ